MVEGFIEGQDASAHVVGILPTSSMRPVAEPDFVGRTDGLEASDRGLGCWQVKVVGAFVLIPADAAAIGGVKRFDPQCNLVVFHLVTLAVFESECIRFSSPHGNSDGVATRASQDSKHEMLDPDKTVIGDPVPLIPRRRLQTWRPCFTAPS